MKMSDQKNIKKTLQDVGKELPFTVPDHYFENFQERLNNRIRKEKDFNTPVRKINRFKPYLAAAAVILVIFIGGMLALRNSSVKPNNSDLHAEISEAVEWDLYSISEETIIEVMNNTGIQESPSSNDKSDEIID